MGPSGMKQDIYNVMTSSRELANYCQESVKSLDNKKVSYSLNNINLKTSVDFIVDCLIVEDQMIYDSKDFGFDNSHKFQHKSIYNKVIDYIEDYFTKSKL